MRETIVQNASGTSVSVGVYLLEPGQKLVLDAEQARVSAGLAEEVGYITATPYGLASWGKPVDLYAAFQEGVPIGVLLASTILMIWIVKLLYKAR